MIFIKNYVKRAALKMRRKYNLLGKVEMENKKRKRKTLEKYQKN